MKVQTRLSLFCSIIFGIIFSVLAFFIYISYYNNAVNAIYKDLKKTAQIAGVFHLEEDELNAKEFEKIRHQFENFVAGIHYQLYDSNNIISYGVQMDAISSDILDKIRKNEELSFTTDHFYSYGFFYEDNQGDFVVITKEKKDFLTQQMKSLLWILLLSLFIGFVAIILLSKWVSKVAYRPFSKVIKQVNNISTHDLNVQIKSPETNDELQNLIDTFNNLLNKISETFMIQKNFVNYVSHEFKTPLTAMLGNLEVFSIKDRSPEEYEQLSQKLIEQIYQLEEILNTLLVISDLRKDTPTTIQTRIDEIIWEIIQKISYQYPNSKIKVHSDILPEDERLLIINKDRTQLLMALFNLIENAVKYSQGEPVEIQLSKQENTLCLSITDKGIGIPEAQLKNVSKPFYRAYNAEPIQGSGIGLSIALRILEKNDIKYTIESKENKGTTIFLSLY